MKVNIPKYVRIHVALLMLSMTFSVHAEGIMDNLYNNVEYSTLLSNDQDGGKNITNVKVSFNPVAGQVSVSLKLTKQSNIVIKLMDALGNEISNLSNTTLEVGSHNLSFDKDEKVTAGFYFVRVSSGTEIIVKRISIR